MAIPPSLMSSFHINISLSPVASDLIVSMGEQGYLEWSATFAKEIHSSLLSIHCSQPLDPTIQTFPLRRASVKSASDIITIGALGITIAGCIMDPKTAKQLATALWQTIKKSLSNSHQEASIELDTETDHSPKSIKKVRKLKITGSDEKAVLALLAAIRAHDATRSELKITIDNE